MVIVRFILADWLTWFCQYKPCISSFNLRDKNCCIVFSIASAKKSRNAVWEPSDKKVNGCQHYSIMIYIMQFQKSHY